MYKHFIFDLDGTLTPSRGEMPKKVADIINELPDVTLISGAEESQMRKQAIGVMLPNTRFMGQNGAEYFNVKLTDEEKREIGDHIARIILKLGGAGITNDAVEDRGSQVSLSFVGHHADPKVKRKFDPDRSGRKKLLKDVPFTSKTLLCLIAGTTCFDYIRKGMDKGGCIDRLIKENKWNKDECIFFGDAIFEGGNDYSVKDVIKCVPVKDYKDTIKKLKKHVSTI